jgi:hypothetical protein
MSNWIELRLTKDEDKQVREGAALLKTTHHDNIENAFKIARGIEILKNRFKGSGVRGQFSAALVQYRYVNRDGGALNKALISHYATLLANEDRVLAWWETVKNSKRARRWLHVSAIHGHWQQHLREEQEAARRREAEARGEKLPPKPRSYTARILDSYREAERKIHDLTGENQELREANDGGNLFTEDSSAEHVIKCVGGMFRTSPAKIRAIASGLKRFADDIDRRIKTARPAKQKSKRELRAEP